MSEALNFLIVLGTAIFVAGSLSVLYATGLRLWSAGALQSDGSVNYTARIGSVLCFSACVAVILFALWLMIPFFH